MNLSVRRKVTRFLVLFFCFLCLAGFTGIIIPTLTVKAEAELTLTVDKNNSTPNGTTTFNSITSAMTYLSNHKPTSEATRATIKIKAGTYKEKIDMNIPYVTFQGDTSSETKLTFNASNKTTNPADSNGGTYGSGNCAALLVNAKDFKANNMTFENSYLKDTGVDTQAACVRVGDDRAIFESCKFYSGQDVLNVNYNRSYFKNCYIEGGVDSVWGLNGKAGFENCTFNQIKNGGAYTAGGGNECYLLMDNCKFTAVPNQQVVSAITAVGGNAKAYSTISSVLFGRTWYAGLHVCIKNSKVTAPLALKGWSNMSSDTIDPSCELLEYKNVDGAGSLLDTSQRNYAKQLSDVEAPEYNIYAWLKGTDGWDPTGSTAAPTSVSDGSYYRIKNVNSGKYLSVPEDSKGAKVVQTATKDSTTSVWQVNGSTTGYFELISQVGSASKVLDVTDLSTENGIQLQIWGSSGEDNQKFKLKDNGDGTFGILTKISGDGKGLDVAGYSKEEGANIQQYNYSASSNQKWTFEFVK